MVAGTGRFDTRVMERLGERVFCKVGAEGVFCAALPSLGLGVAIKIDDGEASFMHTLSDVRLSNWNGVEVGRLVASSMLRESFAS